MGFLVSFCLDLLVQSMWFAFFLWLLAIGNSHGKGHDRDLKAIWKLEDWIRLWMRIGLRHNFFFVG
jgi:hypothetical protein